MNIFAEARRRTAETNNEQDIKKKKRTRQSGSEAINEKTENDLGLKKEEINNKRMQGEHLRVSSENQLQLFGQIINDQREQLQKVADSLQCMQQ